MKFLNYLKRVKNVNISKNKALHYDHSRVELNHKRANKALWLIF